MPFVKEIRFIIFYSTFFFLTYAFLISFIIPKTNITAIPNIRIPKIKLSLTTRIPANKIKPVTAINNIKYKIIKINLTGRGKRLFSIASCPP